MAQETKNKNPPTVNERGTMIIRKNREIFLPKNTDKA